MNQPAGIHSQSEDTASKDEDNLQVSQQQNLDQQNEAQNQKQETLGISDVATNTSPIQDKSLEDYGEMQVIQCMRTGCTNETIDSIDWDGEFCSNLCAVLHCRNIFEQFVEGTIENSSV